MTVKLLRCIPAMRISLAPFSVGKDGAVLCCTESGSDTFQLQLVTLTMDDFSGHVGHLTPEQSAALLDFKSKLIESKLYTPTPNDDNHPASHDDITLLYGSLLCIISIHA